MKRTAIVLTAVLLGALSVQAQTNFVYVGDGSDTVNLANSVYVGNWSAPRGTGVYVEDAAILDMDSVTVRAAGAKSDTIADSGFGGWGMLAAVGTLTINNSSITGGDGTNITATVPVSGANVYGDLGLAVGLQTATIANTTITGGSAGSFSNLVHATTNFVPQLPFRAQGGDAFWNASPGTINLESGTVLRGGDGGMVYNKETLEIMEIIPATTNSPSITNYWPTTANHSSVKGGHGIRYQLGALNVSDGVSAYGGNGGTFINASPDVSSQMTANANGGSGMTIITNLQAYVISGGNYFGGNGGTVQGAQSATAFGGSGVLVSNVTATFAGGVYSKGLGGTIDGVKQDDGGAVWIERSTVNFTGGTYNDEVVVSGPDSSTVTLSGGTFNDALLLRGTGTTDVYLENSLTNFSKITQTDGIANILLWESRHFKDVKIYDGTMAFASDFELADGSTFALLGLNKGKTDFGKFVALPGSTFVTTVGEFGTALLEGDVLELREGAKWIIDGGDLEVFNGVEFQMAKYTTSLNSMLDTNDVEYAGTFDSWLGTIDLLTRVDAEKMLYGTYRMQRFEVALGVDPDSKFGRQMDTLSDFTQIDGSGEDEYVGIKDPSLSKDQAELLLKGAYSSPEMASTLIRLQGLFADQINERTRSYLRRGNWGSKADAPQGANGPAYQVPPGYAVWGRGYGSYLEQGPTDGFYGYDAKIAGGVVGVDKKFSNLLMGLGGGYAHTRLQESLVGRESDSDTLYGTLYAAVNSDHLFLEVSGNLAYNDVATEADPRVGDYKGDFNAYTASFYLGGGIGYSVYKDMILITPEASLLTTYYDRDSYTESARSTDGVWPDKYYDSYNQMSYLGALGLNLSMVEKIESFELEMLFQPELRAHWLHEFNAQMDDETYKMPNSQLPSAELIPQDAVLQARDEDSGRIGAGVRFSSFESDTLEFGLDVDFVFGKDYEAYVGSLKLLHRF